MNRDDLSDIRVILLSGEEFQRSERLDEILEAAVDKPTRDFNMDVFSPETFELETMAGLILTFPMMAERRVIVLRDFDTLHPETRKKASEVIKNAPDTTLVVVEGEKAALSPKPPSRYFRSETFKPVYENNLSSWIQRRFAKRGKKASAGAVALLINNIGNVLRELDTEIEKITITAPEKGLIGEEHVSRVVGPFRHDTVWNLCNAVGLGDFSRAVSILTNLMESEKNKETTYVASLASHIMKIARYNSLINAGVSPDEAVKVAVDNPYFWKLNKMDIQTRNFDRTEIRRILTALAGAESMLKRFTIDKGLVMELLIPFIIPGKGKQETAGMENIWDR